MSPIDVMRYAKQLSVQVDAHEGNLRLRGKKTALDRLAPFVKQHKRELIVELEHANQSNFTDYLGRFTEANALVCWECTHLHMTHERRIDTRRVWFWRCTKGYTVSEVGVRGERVVITPPDCDEFQPWQPGERLSVNRDESYIPSAMAYADHPGPCTGLRRRAH